MTKDSIIYMSQQRHSHTGPLAGLRVLEFVSIGPGPHCAMLLADLGAEVVRIDRPGGNGWPNLAMDRGRSVVTIDIRTDSGRDYCLRAAAHADVLIEGFRPGVMERLGLGPDPLLKLNERLVYGRMTGWGQHGPLAHTAGHDINYIAVTGALAAIGYPNAPAVPPLNLVGDFGGGSMVLAFGILAALFERQKSGLGQVVDAAIVDGVTSMMSMFAGNRASTGGSLQRSQSLLGGAAPFYRCYFCKDGKEISVGALEPAFYADLIERIDAPKEFSEGQYDTSTWAHRTAILTEIFLTRTRSEWEAIFAGSDACFAPVLELSEAVTHPHMLARNSYVDTASGTQAAPVPRFSRTPGAIRPSHANGDSILQQWWQTPLK